MLVTYTSYDTVWIHTFWLCAACGVVDSCTCISLAWILHLQAIDHATKIEFGRKCKGVCLLRTLLFAPAPCLTFIQSKAAGLVRSAKRKDEKGTHANFQSKAAQAVAR